MASIATNTAAFHGIIGQSTGMQQLFQLIARLAEDDLITVLIQGESGTGKELVAKAIHAHGNRSAHHFVPINCAAIPDDLLESELFGYAKGAFTGATAPKIGRIEYAHKGTLFLDEIGDMKPVLQAKLLRVLQEREFEPVGGLKSVPVDVRVVAATHRNLDQMVNEGAFREDLYYRLNVVPLIIPPLRERLEDLPLLIAHFIKTIGKNRKNSLQGFDAQALQALCQAQWKGNVRELENLVRHMSILCDSDVVSAMDLPEKYRPATPLPATSASVLPATIPATEVPETASTEALVPPEMATEAKAVTTGTDAAMRPNSEENASGDAGDAGDTLNNTINNTTSLPDLFAEMLEKNYWSDDGIDFNTLVNDFETRLITQALKQTQGNKKEAARLLNLKRTTLLEKIKKKELTADEFAKEDG